MDVVFGKKLEVPMYQSLIVKTEPVTITNNQHILVCVSKLKNLNFILASWGAKV